MPSFAEALREIPSRLLRYFQVTAQLHGQNRLHVGRKQVDRGNLHLKAQLGAFHQGSGLGREVLAAVAAAVGLWLARLVDLHAFRLAARAGHAFRPRLLDKPLFCGCIVREHLRELDQRESFAKRFPGAFCGISISLA